MMSDSAAARRFPTRLVIAGFIMIVIALACRWYLSWEWIEKEITLDWSEAAWKNPMLAAEQFVQATGYTSEMAHGYQLIDQLNTETSPIQAKDIIILVDAFNSFTDAQVGKLVAWTEAGGTLVASSENRFRFSKSKQDKLLQHFGVTVEHNVEKEPRPLSAFEKLLDGSLEEELQQAAETSSADEAVAQDCRDDAESACDSDSDDAVHVPKNGIVVQQEDGVKVIATPGWGPTLYFDETDEKIVYRASERGVELISVPANAGKFVVSSSNNMWNNFNIYDADNAYLLWLLLPAKGKVWFVLNEKAPSLLAWLWRISSVAIVALLCWLLCWLWRKAMRFGPVVSTDLQTSRRFLEHLESAARLLWRRGQGNYMVAELREDTHRKVLQRHPHLQAMETNAQLQALRKITRLSSQTLAYLYLDADVRNERVFIDNVKQLQLIRERL